MSVNKTSSILTSSSRPAVILLDESCSDQDRSGESEFSELTFGFEINEQLLQSEGEEEDETLTTSPELTRLTNSPPSRNKQQNQAQLPQQAQIPPMYEKQQQHVRCDKFPPNFAMNAPYIQMHAISSHPVLLPAVPYAALPVRLQGPYVLQQPTLPFIDKCRNHPKEDFSTRYVPPNESHVQNFNHDKIVSFVGTGKFTSIIN